MKLEIVILIDEYINNKNNKKEQLEEIEVALVDLRKTCNTYFTYNFSIIVNNLH